MTPTATSAIPDLDGTPLEDTDRDDDLAALLRRIVPAAPGQGVTVAAFNSSV